MTVDLQSAFDGTPSVLTRPFCGAASLLRWTTERLVSFGLGDVVLVLTDAPASEQALRDLADLPLRNVKSVGGTHPLERAAEYAEQEGLQGAVLVDPRAACISASLLRRQLEALTDRRDALVVCRGAARGLSGLAIHTHALRRLAAAHREELRFAPTIDLEAWVDKIGSMFEVIDLPCSPEHAGLSVDLIPARAEDVRELEAIAGRIIAGNQEALDAYARSAWEQWTALPTSPVDASARDRILVAHYTTRAEFVSSAFFVQVLEHLARSFQVSVALPNEGPLYQRLRDRFSIQIVPTRFFSNSSYYLPGRNASEEVVAWTQYLRTIEPATVYVSGAIPSLGVACRLAGIPTLCHLHMPILLPERLIAAEWALPSVYDRIVTPSDSARDSLAVAFRAPSGRICSIANGIDLVRFDPDRIDSARARARFGWQPDTPVIVVCGAIDDPVKQTALAIESLAALHRDDVLLAFAGGARIGGAQASLTSRANELGVAARVQFLGFVHDIEQVYSAADVVLQCSRLEQFGLSLLEALAMRRPAVALDAGGSTSLLADGRAGRLLPHPSDARAIADALDTILSMPEVARDAMGTVGRELAGQFSLARSLDSIEAELRTLIARRTVREARSA